MDRLDSDPGSKEKRRAQLKKKDLDRRFSNEALRQDVKPRKGDFLMDFKDDLNEMLKVLEERGAIQLKHAKTGQVFTESGGLAI